MKNTFKGANDAYRGHFSGLGCHGCRPLPQRQHRRRGWRGGRDGRRRCRQRRRRGRCAAAAVILTSSKTELPCLAHSWQDQDETEDQDFGREAVEENHSGPGKKDSGLLVTIGLRFGTCLWNILSYFSGALNPTRLRKPISLSEL